MALGRLRTADPQGADPLGMPVMSSHRLKPRWRKTGRVSPRGKAFSLHFLSPGEDRHCHASLSRCSASPQGQKHWSQNKSLCCCSPDISVMAMNVNTLSVEISNQRFPGGNGTPTSLCSIVSTSTWLDKETVWKQSHTTETSFTMVTCCSGPCL